MPLASEEAGGGDTSPVCPFLRLERPPALSAPASVVDVDHRCVALGSPVPVSEAQQSLVCLVATHADCPRYLRGSHLVPAMEPPSRRAIPRPTIAAAAVLALSLAGTLAFTAANGGLAIPTVPSTPAASEAVARSPALATPASGTPAASLAPSPSPTPAAPTPDLASPSVAASPTPTPASSPAGGGPTADRLALLQPCPGRPDCYIYVVRAGDNLTSIGLFFGVPFDTLLRLNPWIHDPTTIHKGEQIILTTPTR